MAHDFIKFPELTNRQMEIYYVDSPHKQITESFEAKVVKVIDGDTIRVQWDERDFDFPVRFANIDALELSEGGQEAKSFLESLINGEDIDIIINRFNRVGKFGRIIGEIIHQGMNINEQMKREGFSVTFGNTDGKIPNINNILSHYAI